MTRRRFVLVWLARVAGCSFAAYSFVACSFSIDGPDPKRATRTAPTCETGKGRVLTDGLIAATMGAVTVGVAADSGAAALIPAVIGAVFVGAAVYGNNSVEDCRKINAEYLALQPDEPPPQRQVLVAPPTVEAPPPPMVAPPAQPAPAPAWAAFWKEVR